MMSDLWAWAVIVATIVAAITGILQVVIMWFQLRELGDLDRDRKDWFEGSTFRHYRKDE